MAAAEWAARESAVADLTASQAGVGREFFTTFRQAATGLRGVG